MSSWPCRSFVRVNSGAHFPGRTPDVRSPVSSHSPTRFQSVLEETASPCSWLLPNLGLVSSRPAYFMLTSCRQAQEGCWSVIRLHLCPRRVPSKVPVCTWPVAILPFPLGSLMVEVLACSCSTVGQFWGLLAVFSEEGGHPSWWGWAGAIWTWHTADT